MTKSEIKKTNFERAFTSVKVDEKKILFLDTEFPSSQKFANLADMILRFPIENGEFVKIQEKKITILH